MAQPRWPLGLDWEMIVANYPRVALDAQPWAVGAIPLGLKKTEPPFLFSAFFASLRLNPTVSIAG